MRSHCYTATPEQSAEIAAAEKDLREMAETVSAAVREIVGRVHVSHWIMPRGMDDRQTITGYVGIRAGRWAIGARAQREGRDAAGVVAEVRETLRAKLDDFIAHHDAMARLSRAARAVLR
jgi:hypothetical protein